MNLTRTTAALLDKRRRLLLGRRARLAVLDHDPGGGYSQRLEIPNGWVVGEDDDGVMVAEIAETGAVTGHILSECAALAFRQAHENAARVCKIISRKEPVGELTRVWEFTVTPTGEGPVEIN